MKILPDSFYLRSDVLQIAKELLGKVLVTNWNGAYTSGRIVETEAYAGELDRASHAFRGITPRTAVMFGQGGVAYVYLCYGIHNLFNIVTNKAGIAEAILIRAIEPMTGIDTMNIRRGRPANQFHLTSGPGKLTQALGIDRTWNGKSLLDGEVWIENAKTLSANLIEKSKRIGIDYAGKDAKLPWRFTIKKNKWVSR